MKRHVQLLLTTISTAALTTVLGIPATAFAPRVYDSPLPIERLASIRLAYLSELAGQSAPDAQQPGDKLAQFRNFPNFPNFSNWRNR